MILDLVVSKVDILANPSQQPIHPTIYLVQQTRVASTPQSNWADLNCIL